MPKKSDKKNKLLWLTLGTLTPLILIILSLFPMFEYAGMATVVIYPKSIFSFLTDAHIVIACIVLIVYFYVFIFSFTYWKKEIKYGKTIHVINLLVSIICFITTFVLAYNAALESAFVLLFLS